LIQGERLAAGRYEYPFRLQLESRGAADLLETFHGLNINIIYLIRYSELSNSVLKL
jgi:hypothetical protein